MVSLRAFLKEMIPSALIQQRLRVKGAILLTFDDGPDPQVTPRILDILDRYNARGLFFIPANRIERAPRLMREIVTRQHGIGNHSYSHAACNQLSFQQIKQEIVFGHRALLAASGVSTTLFRPPRGIVTAPLVVAARRCRHRIVRWSLDSGEYSYLRNASSSAIATNLLQKLHDRAIVLFHDDHPSIPEVLNTVLPRMLDLGYNLTAGLDSLSWCQTHGIKTSPQIDG